MSWYDRDYYRDRPRQHPYGTIGWSLPKPTPVVKYLLIINLAVFVLGAIWGPALIRRYFALWSGGVRELFEIWRLITYQFLHSDTNVWHLVFNMIGIYFLGPPLERHWGSRRFLTFYLGCGVAGGVAFLILGGLTAQANPIVGASGAVLGLLAACALLFPQMMIILLFFPVPIRFAALLLGGVYLLSVLSTASLSNACHLGGMLAGLAYVWFGPAWRQFSSAQKRGQWEKRLAEEQAEQEMVDRILAKVHREGIDSLSRHEKRALRQATERQRERDKQRERRLR